jgi:hypothetical protein
MNLRYSIMLSWKRDLGPHCTGFTGHGEEKVAWGQPPHIPKKRRSCFHGNRLECGPIPSPAPAAMRTSTRATVTATGEAIVTGTAAPVATSSDSYLRVLADVSQIFARDTSANNTRNQASRREKLLQDVTNALNAYEKNKLGG